jgi:hypothetical protein
MWTDVTTSVPTFDRRRAVLFAGVGLATHVLAIAVAFVVVRASRGGEGLSDLGRGATAFFLVEIVAGLACLVGGGVLFRLGRRDVGLGLVLGWVVGLFLSFVFFMLVAR